jgi:phosphonate transport system substrate-binding protein
MKTVVLFVLLALSITAPAFAQAFRFTAIPDENTARLKERFDQVAVYLSDKLGIQVEYIPVKSYSASVAAFKNNEVQLAWFGGLSGVQARRGVPGSVAIAQGEEDMQFVTYFIANAQTGLQPSDKFPAAAKGKTFTFGSKGSTSGRLMPEFFIRDHFKAAPDKVFKRVGFSGDHSKTLSLVQSGSYEVGALNYKVWENELKAGNVDTSKVRVIWKTPSYPDYNWTVRGDVEKKYGKGFIKKIKDALIKMEDRKLLDSFPRARFIEADNAMYKPILDTAMEIGIIDK